MTRKKIDLTKEMGVFISVSCVIDGDTWLNDSGWLAVYYLSDITPERLDDGYTTECRIGMIFVTGCIDKLYYHVTLCISCHILIVSNDISHLGIKVISRS